LDNFELVKKNFKREWKKERLISKMGQDFGNPINRKESQKTESGIKSDYDFNIKLDYADPIILPIFKHQFFVRFETSTLIFFYDSIQFSLSFSLTI